MAPPPDSAVKVNVDATFFTSPRRWVLEWLLEMDEGEAMWVFEALSWIKDLGFQRVIIEMDAKLVFDVLQVLQG